MLPGAFEDRDGRHNSVASTNAGGLSPRRVGLQDGKVFHTDIWELVSGVWKVTHQFNTGLELDSCLHPISGKRCSRVHLPSTSLRSLQQLRSTLQRLGSVACDVGALSDHAVFGELLEHMGQAVTSENKVEAIATLRLRGTAAKISQLTVETDSELQSARSEDLLAPELGSEAVDISICPLSSFGGLSPEVALARLATPGEFGARKDIRVRYAMLVLCSSWQAGALQLANEVASAFAGAVMDEDFAAALLKGAQERQEGILRAFDAYLSSVTIVPTVYMKPESEAVDGRSPSKEECLLADSIVDGIEKLIGQSRDWPQSNLDALRRHHNSSDSLQQPPELRRRFFVDVSAAKPGGRWRTTNRLMQGLELDTTTQTATPHLPRISVAALARARQLLAPACVGLGAVASSGEAVVQALVHQLSLAGLPLLAAGEITETLQALLAVDEEAQGGNSRDLGLAVFKKILEPTGGEEACHVLAVACRKFPRSHAPVAAFVRIKSPLEFQLPSAKIPARFFFVFVGSEGAERELLAVGDSLAALATDEDLMGNLNAVRRPEDFVRALNSRMDNLTIVPHARVSGKTSSSGSFESKADAACALEEDVEEGGPPPARALLSSAVSKMQKYSMPLISGVLTALVWSNVDTESFKHFTTDPIVQGAEVLGHPLSLKFIVNDIFMCFFFGLAIKEVTEALLPGGSLSPLKRAINPLMATIGGIVGPVVAYVGLVLVLWYAGVFEGMMCTSSSGGGGGHRRLAVSPAATVVGVEEPCRLGVLINGWGVPTATDISLAWMFALLIFGTGHPSINFLLLLAIVDDAIGMAIIAINYPDPDHPVEPVWLLLVFAAAVVSFLLRMLQVPVWQPYVMIAGPISWLGLLKAHVHPALALVFVVPLMPASHAVPAQKSTCDLGACDLGPRDKAEQVAQHFNVSEEQRSSAATIAAKILARYHAEEAPLHVFEHTMKLPVDLGMLFFGLCNAGVKLNSVGGLTGSVVFALLVGKTLGIAGFGLLAVRLGFGLPPGVTKVDLFAMSAVGGVGLTVALFVANEAFVDPGLQGQAKFGAVLSVLAALLAWLIKVIPAKLFPACQVDCLETAAIDGVSMIPVAESKAPGAVQSDLIEDCLADDILHVLWLQRRYAMRGERWSSRSAAKTPSSLEARSRCHSSHGQAPICATPPRFPGVGLRSRSPMHSEDGQP